MRNKRKTFALLIFFFLETGTLFAGSETPKVSAAASFVFTAAGDCAKSKDTTASLTLVSQIHPAFHLALGDLSYNKKPESEWCGYVKNIVGADFPFEIVSGNHESRGKHGLIEKFADCLPDKMGAVGEYGKEYFFDYPSQNPLARFILISPDLKFSDGRNFSYEKGSVHYEWLKSRIEEAKKSGFSWIIVGMHKNCISAGQKSCEIGEDLMNLLVAEKVDLVLQGHDHTYQRSKQLALGSYCGSIRADRYNSDCVAAAGKDRTYPKGHGTVIVIDGTFGADLSLIRKSGPDAHYFAATMGLNLHRAKGFVKYTVSKEEISAEFVRSAGKKFQDHFSIKKMS